MKNVKSIENESKIDATKKTDSCSVNNICKTCGLDFKDNKYLRCPRCGTNQKQNLECNGNCSKCQHKH